MVDEQANTMRLTQNGKAMTFTIEVPRRTNLKLSIINGQTITVDGVEGDIETNNLNGPSTTLTNVSGSVVANSTNGKVVATIARVAAQKAMAFTSLNGSRRRDAAGVGQGEREAARATRATCSPISTSN